MKIYTLSYYSKNGLNAVLGNYSTYDKAKEAMQEENEACDEVIDTSRVIESIGYYPLVTDDGNEVYYEISLNVLDDLPNDDEDKEEEEEDEEYDDEYDDYDDDDEDDDEEYDDDEDNDDWDEDDEEEDDEDYEDGEDDESEVSPWEILSQLLRKGLCGIGIIVGE